MRSAVTISLVPEAKGGPFVFWGNLAENSRTARAIGFDAIEVFAPSPEALIEANLAAVLEENHLQLAALGTGAGWVRHRLTLTHPESEVRQQAIRFISRIIDAGAPHGAPAIIGSMQGRFDGPVDRSQALAWLAEGLQILGERAHNKGTTLLYEPLNRYETNLVNRIQDGVELLQQLETRSVRLLVDLFHANIEESSTANAIRTAGNLVGHVHFVDSNRRAPGSGQIRFDELRDALKTIGYQGYLSAEALPLPDPESAARLTLSAYRQLTQQG